MRPIDPWLAVRFRTYFLLVLILVAPAALVFRTHLGGGWLDTCEERQVERLQQQSLKQDQSARPSANAIKITAKRTCIVLESALGAVVAVGAFGFVMLLWWKLGEVRGLRQVFETPWIYLDDNDVGSVGAIRSMAYAAVFAIVILTCASVLFFSVAGVRDAAIVESAAHLERSQQVNKRTSNAESSGAEGALARLVELVTSRLNDIQTRRGLEGKAGDATDSARSSSGGSETPPPNRDAAASDAGKMEKLADAITALLKTIDAHVLEHRPSGKEGAGSRGNKEDPAAATNEKGSAPITDKKEPASAADRQGPAALTSQKDAAPTPTDKASAATPTDQESPAAPTSKEPSASPTSATGPASSVTATNREASAAPADSKVATTLATGDGLTTPTNDSVEPLRQPINQSSMPSSGACFAPEFRADPDQNVQRLRTESATERRRIGLPDGATFREIKDYVVFFDTAASRMSSGAEERLTQFLSSRPASNVALSIRGFADGRGSPAANERLSRDRAVEVATLVANAHRYPPIVELDWSVHGAVAPPHDRGQSDPYQRIVRVKVLQPCQ